ncbi:MAG: hypothetical protein ABJA60_10570 [Nitrosospira sp.]
MAKSNRFHANFGPSGEFAAWAAYWIRMEAIGDHSGRSNIPVGLCCHDGREDIIVWTHPV